MSTQITVIEVTFKSASELSSFDMNPEASESP
jgi:hypothetical protein